MRVPGVSAAHRWRRSAVASASGCFWPPVSRSERALLLLDEPATFLDVDQQLQCFSVLRAEADRGIACVAVTHDVNLALTFCTRLIVLAERERGARSADRDGARRLRVAARVLRRG